MDAKHQKTAQAGSADPDDAAGGRQAGRQAWGAGPEPGTGASPLSVGCGITLIGSTLVAALLLGGLLGWLLVGPPQGTGWNTGPTVDGLKLLRELASLRVSVSDILDVSDGNYRGVWLIRGDAILSIDLAAATVQADAGGRTATITLPPPRVIQARVDHERSRTWDVRKQTWLPAILVGGSTELFDRAMREGQRLVERTASMEEQVGPAKQQAERLLRTIYGEVGWQVRVVWRDAPGGDGGAVGGVGSGIQEPAVTDEAVPAAEQH